QGLPCYRQIDSLADGLKPRYNLDERNYTACGKCFNRYTADYILYDPNVVEPVPGTHEDIWNVGPSGKLARFAAYQLFQVKATDAIVHELFRTARRGHGSIEHMYATGRPAVQTCCKLLHITSSGDFVQPNPSDDNPVWVDAAIPF